LKYVSYLRVSTQKQGASGLGLEAQRSSVRAFVRDDDIVLAEYIEVESGKKNDRPQLEAALSHARAAGATLLIAKLDRLARNVAFIANLMEAGVEITAVDLPQANRFMLHIMAAVAEQEARAISERTIAALAAAKARGKQLGWANPSRLDHADAHQASMRSRKHKADAFVDQHGATIAQRRLSGVSFSAIAEEFNRQSIPAPRGGKWWPSTVKTAYERYLSRRS